MKKITATLLLLTNLYGYDVGDRVDATLASHIGFEKDKVYIVDFFASWCGSCKKEIPLLSKANRELDKTKFEIVGIDVDKKVENGIEFQDALRKRDRLNFRVINDPQNLIISKFSPIGMPTLYYVKNQKVLKILTGAIDDIDQVVIKDLHSME
jgi:thiol-disulfide isomerase/thioredoxin